MHTFWREFRGSQGLNFRRLFSTTKWCILWQLDSSTRLVSTVKVFNNLFVTQVLPPENYCSWTKGDMTVSSLIARNVDFDSFVTFNTVSRHFQDLMHPWGMNRMQGRMKRLLYPGSCPLNVQKDFLQSNDSKKCLMLVDLNKGVDTGWMKKEE